MHSYRRHDRLLEELLSVHAVELGCDFEGYRGHCYRVLNFCAALAPHLDPEMLAITTVFHDIGIWTEGTFDYLDPSVQAASRYLKSSGREPWIQEVGATIRKHHKIFPAKVVSGSLVEAFRRADWIDVSMGVLTFGLSREMIRGAFTMWPSAGFHRRLIQLSWERFKVHPLSPLPMLKL